jgi:hypothetical protein
MKFINFINETTPGTNKKVNNILTDIIINFKSETHNKKLNSDEKFLLLSSLFKKHNIYISREFSETSSFVSQGLTNLITLKIFISFNADDLEEFFHILDGTEKDDNKLMIYIMILTRTLEHEIIHKEQLNKIPLEVRRFMKGISKERQNLKYIDSMKKYLSEPIEIEAFAYNIVSQLRQNGTSDFLNVYKEIFEKDSDVMKKLMKKIYFYQKEFEKENETR